MSLVARRVGVAVLVVLLALPGGTALGGPDAGALRKILEGELVYEGLPDEPPDAPAHRGAPADGGAGGGDERPDAAEVAEGESEGADSAPPEGGSVSLGYTALGSLERAAEVPARGEGFALLPFVSERGTQFATDELVGLLRRAAARVREAYPDAVVRIGNVSARRGGKIEWSVSHRAGRDADVAFFVEDPRGRALPVSGYEEFGKDGASRGNRRRRFAVARNWALVQALVLDPAVPVQRIFVADWLRERLLAHARSSGADPQAILRAELVLGQPRDSAPHADHFHIRIYCSRDDRLEGCHNFGPVWPWVDPHDGAVARRIAELVRELRQAESARKLAALEKLRRLEAHGQAAAVGRLLLDGDARVRKGALRCLLSLHSEDVGPSLLAALRVAEEPEWATRLLTELRRHPARGLTALVDQMFADLEGALPELGGTARQRAALQAEAAQTLGFSGRPRSVPRLIERLTDPDPGLRVAAARALPYLTNHDFGGRWGKGVLKARLEKQQERWRSWYKENQKSSQPQWIRLGFQKKGIRFRGKMVSRDAIPQLIRVLRRGGYLAHNARRILVQVVGSAPAHRCDTNASCWETWWRKHHRDYGHRAASL